MTPHDVAGLPKWGCLLPSRFKFRYPDVEPPEALDRQASIALMDEILTWTQAPLDATPPDTST